MHGPNDGATNPRTENPEYHRVGSVGAIVSSPSPPDDVVASYTNPQTQDQPCSDVEEKLHQVVLSPEHTEKQTASDFVVRFEKCPDRDIERVSGARNPTLGGIARPALDVTDVFVVHLRALAEFFLRPSVRATELTNSLPETLCRFRPQLLPGIVPHVASVGCKKAIGNN